METWFDKVQSYTPQQYYAAGFADPTHTPTIYNNGLLGDRVIAYLYFAEGVGVDPSLLNQIAAYGKTVDLHPLRGERSSAPKLERSFFHQRHMIYNNSKACNPPPGIQRMAGMWFN
jgi:hypothetical protein